MTGLQIYILAAPFVLVVLGLIAYWVVVKTDRRAHRAK